MARVKYGSLISEISGSIGSSTFQKSSYGNTLRTKPRPRRTQSDSQNVCRRYMSQLHIAWRSLTDDERRQWNQFISYSGQKILRDKNVLLTGHSLFLKYNFMRLFAHLAIMTVPVYQPLPVWPTTLDELAFDEGTMGAYFESADASNLALLVSASIPRNPSLRFSASGLRMFYGTGEAAQPCNVYPAYNTVFGFTPAEGDTLHYTYQWFSMISPAYSAIFKGIIQVTEYH